ncbi:glycoside hydrolase family 99-like domain-containing protein [Porcincola sp. LCP21S3_C12]|uniref:glycoside hydrolase family 99-like domain-containing protein n=1 Tax=Porcincola sp. LCP21S3_C12 TaxID=3438798 RepID=UPI003F9DCEAC
MKTIAFYLPQFHETPENNKWWGKGFTEWTNMKKAKPLFEGHYQPRVPLNKNYYDLSNPNTIRWQAELAKENGIYGFCLYHYWFNGKLLLQKPVELLRDNKDIDIHYCLCWANENWTNGWVSDKANILIEHNFNDRSCCPAN